MKPPIALLKYYCLLLKKEGGEGGGEEEGDVASLLRDLLPLFIFEENVFFLSSLFCVSVVF